MLLGSLALFGSDRVSAANSVVVGSVDADPGESSVVVPIHLSNDVSLRGVILPLVLRKVAGDAYATTLQIQFADRLPAYGPLSAIRFTNIQSVDGECGPEGLGTILYSDESSHPVSAPVGVTVVAQRIIGGDLFAGADATGSVVLTLDIGTERGVFEIDATCSDPSNEVLFVDAVTSGAIYPTFQKGIVTVGLVFMDGFDEDSLNPWSTVVNGP